jgi:ribulose-bisphosphate carboxylase small chain
MQTLPKERRYETLSYLPPLSDAQIAKQVQYIITQGFIPAIEFNETSEPTELYWTMWKLPLFGALAWIRWYNQTRMHSTLNYVSPAEFENNWGATKRHGCGKVEKQKALSNFPTATTTTTGL